MTDGKKCGIEKVSREMLNRKNIIDSKDPTNKQTHNTIMC
jgi:hypothetical protein